MFNLASIVQSAQGGQAIANIAEQFGLPADKAQQAVNALLPALSAGLKSNAGDPQALASVAGQVSDPQHQAAFKDADAAQSDEAQTAGRQALTQLVGGDQAIDAIAQKAAAVSGVSPELLQRMLPQVTSIALGGVMTAMQNRGMGGLVQQLGQAAGSSSSGGIGGLVGGLMGSLLGGSKPQQDGSPTQAGLSTLTQLFDHGTGASGLEQEFAQLIQKNG